MNSRKLNILLIDDNDIDFELLKRAFDKITQLHSISHCTDAIEALEYLESDRHKRSEPVIILLDINMPKMNGNEFLKVLKENPRLQKIPVFIFSSSEHPIDVVKAYENHATAYIQKPNGLKEMTNFLKSFLSFLDYITLF